MTGMRPAHGALAVMILSACSGGTAHSSTPQDGQPQPARAAAVAAKPADPRDRLGVNLGAVTYWAGERAFANIAKASEVWLDQVKSWSPVDAKLLDAAGYPRAGGNPVLLLTPPAAVLGGKDVVIRCTWAGSGRLSIGGTGSWLSNGNHRLDFRWTGSNPQTARIWLSLSGNNDQDPFRDLDCREPGLAKIALFSPEFVAALKPFGVLRFLDWSAANGNPASVTWATRTTPDSLTQRGSDGVAIENLVALAREAKADPWFTIPWNADADYQQRMAQLVHDTMPRDRRGYVENGNEGWNFMFGVANQSAEEGMKQKLAPDRYLAGMRRYADKTSAVMKIWTKVFADRPGQLVRVVAAQNANPWVGEQILGWGDVARYADAYAVAPYFGGELFNDHPGVTDHDQLMAFLAADAQQILKRTAGNAELARKYGLRFITYEAGQHVINPPAGVTQQSIQRDPRMYDIYKAYLTSWQRDYGDTITLYNHTGGIGPSGAWGMREDGSRTLAESPKMRAVWDFAGAR